MMKKFEFIEHTADVAVRVYGNKIEELFSNSALALKSLLTSEPAGAEIKKEINLEADDLEELLVNWLNELISLFFACKFLPCDYSIVIEEENALKKLKALVHGQEFDPYERRMNMEVKAATYHDLKIRKVNEKYIAEIIFDV